MDRIKKASQGNEAYAWLISEIRTGALQPGARLTETDLAERLGISRTPVREALRKLEADGLVVHRPRLGAVIRTLDRSEVMELYQMRTVLEGTAAQLATRAASDVELEEMTALNAEMSGVLDDGARLYALNQQFHGMLLEAARNRYLVRSVQAIQKTLLILGPSTLEESSRAVQAVAEHDRILAALIRRNEAEAEVEMRAHIEAAYRMRLRLQRNLDVQQSTEG